MSIIAIIGTGAMGRGIIQWAAEAGATVLAYDSHQGAAKAAVEFVAGIFSSSVSKGRMSATARDDVLRRISTVDDIAALSVADFAIEAIVEDLTAKRALLDRLEGVLRDDAFICTNTSSLSVTACARDCRLPGRVAGLHFFNPVPVMKVAEVIRGERTEPETIARIIELVELSTHLPVLCNDTPGFVVNHAGRGAATEGLRIVQEGVATFADVDNVVRECVGLPMGPFELFDLTGFDVSSRVLHEVYEGFMHEPRYRPTPIVNRRASAGLFGRKTGEGFYKYNDGRKVEVPERDAPVVSPARVFVDGPSLLAKYFESGPTTVVPRAADADVIVVCPFGYDATTAASEAGYDPKKVVAVDALLPIRLVAGERATIMSTPLTAQTAVDCVHAVLATNGIRVTRISDSPGFIAQRLVANIVNTACEIAQQKIASPNDIEQGVKRGLRYPAGPLEMGDNIGPRLILEILERIQRITGDMRYRPSLWLRRRAMLNASLMTQEN